MKTTSKWMMATGSTLLVAGITVFSLSGEIEAKDQPQPQQAPAVPVDVAKVIERNVQHWHAFSGRLEAVDRVDIRPRVEGVIRSIHFTEGSLVKQGDLLFSIDPDLYEAAVAQAKAGVAAARARLSYSKGEADRAQRLAQKNAIADRDVDQRVNAYREAQADVLAAEAALRTATLNLSYTNVRAPVSGRVGRIEVTQGNLVSAGPSAPVLTHLVSISPIYVSFDADESTVTQTLAGLGKGQGINSIPVEIATGNDHQSTEGRLQLVDNQVDALSGTIRLRATFDNADGRLIPGQFARVSLGESESQPTTLISEKAVGTDQDKKYVMVVNDDHVTYRQITLGDSVQGLREVTSGLNPGDEVIISGLQRVRPGMLVKPEVVPMQPHAEAQLEKAPANASQS